MTRVLRRKGARSAGRDDGGLSSVGILQLLLPGLGGEVEDVASGVCAEMSHYRWRRRLATMPLCHLLPRARSGRVPPTASLSRECTLPPRRPGASMLARFRRRREEAPWPHSTDRHLAHARAARRPLVASSRLASHEPSYSKPGSAEAPPRLTVTCTPEIQRHRLPPHPGSFEGASSSILSRRAPRRTRREARAGAPISQRSDP